MKIFLYTFFSLSFLFSSSWQPIHNEIPSKTRLKTEQSNIENTILEFNIDGFHLIPVQNNNEQMYIVNLEDGASILELGSPDIDKFAKDSVLCKNFYSVDKIKERC